MRDYRTLRPGTYQEMTSAFRWEVPASYNLAADVLDKHEPDRPAMRFVSDEGRDERWSFGDVRRLTDIQLTETQQSEAREQLMARFAQDLYQRLIEMF